MKYTRTLTGKRTSSRALVSIILSITLAISGIHHGFFEVLQGNTPTNAFFIESIGPSHQRWAFGNDGALTLIPNFLITGIVAILISLLIIYWALFRIKGKNGIRINFILFILLTLTGGGIGHIPFYLLAWAYSTNMNSNLSWWRKRLPGKTRGIISKTWLVATVLSGILFIIGLEISVFGYVPNVSDPDQILTVCWSSLFASLVLMNYAYISAFAMDIERNL